jgi:uncharacterized membrane protein
VSSGDDSGGTVFVADFAHPGSAWDANERLKAIEEASRTLIDGVVVVERGTDGVLEIQRDADQSTESGLVWGAVGGVVLGVLFPPSILGSAFVLGAAGATTGKVRQLRHRNELEGKLEDSIEPGHSGLVVLVAEDGAARVRSALSGAASIAESAVSPGLARAIKALAQDDSPDIEGPPSSGSRPQLA